MSEPDAPGRERLAWALRVVAVLTSLLLAATVVLIAWFAWSAEQAHRVDRCPFEPTGSRQAVDGVGEVVEESRACVPGIVEHRWRLPGGDELGRRRLPERLWQGHRWSVAREEGALRVRVEPAEGPPFVVRPR